MGARVGGNLTLSIQTRMHETTLTAGVSSLVLNEIQQIHINTTVTNEKQVSYHCQSRCQRDGLMLFYSL